MAVSVQEEIKSWNDLGWKKPPRPSSPAVDVTSGQLCTLRELRHLLSPQPQSRVTISRRFVPISHPHVTTPSSASPRECGQKNHDSERQNPFCPSRISLNWDPEHSQGWGAQHPRSWKDQEPKISVQQRSLWVFLPPEHSSEAPWFLLLQHLSPGLADPSVADAGKSMQTSLES